MHQPGRHHNRSVTDNLMPAQASNPVVLSGTEIAFHLLEKTANPHRSTMHYLLLPLLAAFTLAFTLVPAMAQVVDPTRVGEGIRPLTVPNLFAEDGSAQQGLEDENDFAPESPGDGDIGQQLILKDSERERWLSAQMDTFMFWSDNPANLSKGKEEDVFWGSQINVGAQPRLGERLYADAFINQQVYRYDKNDLLDYEYLQAGLGLVYLEPRLWNSILFSQFHYGRTTNDDFRQEILNSYSFIAGIQKTILIDRSNSIYMNLMADWDIDADVDQFAKSEYIADLSYRYKIMRDLVFSASYRFTWYDYQDVDRSDTMNTLGAYLTWMPKKWLNVYVGSSYNHNESNVDAFDYQTTNIGGGVGIHFRF